MTVRNLEHAFAPRSVAVIGASAEPRSVGNKLTENVMAGSFAGEIYLVNPHQELIGGPSMLSGHRRAASGADSYAHSRTWIIAPAPKNQSACEKAGMNWDATASAPKVKCNAAVA